MGELRGCPPLEGAAEDAGVRGWREGKAFPVTWGRMLIGISCSLTRIRKEEEGMTQTELVKMIAEANGLSTAQAKGVMATLAELAVKEVRESGLFVIPGIGRLVRVDRAARTGRNPATGETIQIGAKQVVKFRVAKVAKDAIVPVVAAKKAAKKKP